jgi:hypothetical protein
MKFTHLRPVLGTFAATALLGSSLLGLSGSASASTAAPSASSQPVLVDCLGHGHVKPKSEVLTCADANDALTKMVWSQWATQALGTGSEAINTCVPNCAQGHIKHYPVITVLWRQQARKSPSSGKSYSRATIIYPGQVPKGFTQSRTVHLPR